MKSPVDGNEDARASTQHQQIAAHQDGERASVNPTVTQPPSKKDQWHEDQKGYWERQIRTAKALNVISIAGSLIAFGGLGILYWQTQISQTTSETAIAQLNMTQALHKTTERAWVTVKAAQVKPPIATGQIPEIAIEFHNSGHSPALRIKIRHLLSIKDKLPGGPMPEIMATGIENNGLVGPEASMLLHFTPTNLTNDLISLMKSGKGYLFAFGTFKYFDVFDTEHETKFCYFVQDVNKADMSPCGQWNEAN